MREYSVDDKNLPTEEMQARMSAAAELLAELIASGLNLGPQFSIHEAEVKTAAWVLRDAVVWAQCMSDK